MHKRHNADLFVVLLLFCIYAVCALLLCALGASSYNETVALMQSDYNQRSGVLYIAQKVHQNDIGGSLRIDEYQGTDALVLVEQETGLAYETWIFIKDGQLSEEFIAAGSDIIDEQAQIIMPMQDMQLTLSSDGLLSVSLTTDTGTVNVINLALRSGGGPYNFGATPPRSPAPSAEEGPAVVPSAPGREGGA